MRVSTLTSAAFLSSALIACSSTSDSARMLDLRSQTPDPFAMRSLSIKEGGISGYRGAPMPTRTRARVVPAFLHPTEFPTKDYFWGGWISLVVEKDGWVFGRPNQMPKVPFSSPMADGK